MKNLLNPTNNSSNNYFRGFRVMLLPALILCATSYISSAQTGSAKVVVPDWALPGSATHQQVPPPLDFHRETKTENTKIGVFEGQSDVGAALVPGSSSYNAKTKQYTIISAGYNIWYTRDEFRYLWKRMSGDVSLAADVNFPDKEGYDDRKVVLVIRQDLKDDSKEVMAGIHGGGLIHLAYRPDKNAEMKDMKADKRSALRLGIEKHGDSFTIFLSMNGEPMKQCGEPLKLKMDEPFYVGVGLCSHIPDQTTTAVLSNVVLENAAGRLK
jgi:hypothetical protein